MMMMMMMQMLIDAYLYVCVCMRIGMYMYVEKLKNKVFQRDEFIVKESRRYNISVLISHHQDFKNDD